jgi:hypothetical protein
VLTAGRYDPDLRSMTTMGKSWICVIIGVGMIVSGIVEIVELRSPRVAKG